MKKLVAASLLSVSLFVSQAGGAWASTQTHFPPPMSSEGTDVSPQNVIVAGVVASLIAAIIYDILKSTWSGWYSDADENMEKACDFYEEHRWDYDIWSHDYMQDLSWKAWNSSQCDDLFDINGYDFDEKHECYIWEIPEDGSADGYELCEYP